jgi:hypothetical protein
MRCTWSKDKIGNVRLLRIGDKTSCGLICRRGPDRPAAEYPHKHNRESDYGDEEH